MAGGSAACGRLRPGELERGAADAGGTGWRQPGSAPAVAGARIAGA